MFKSFREKLKNWTRKISEKKEKEADEVSEKDREKITKIVEEKEGLSDNQTGEKEVKVPLNFNAGTQKYEPNVEKIQEIEKQIEETEKDEEIREREKEPEKIEEKEGFLGRLGRRISTTKISEKEIEDYGEELKMLLLENNVAFEVAEEIIGKLKEQMTGREIIKSEIEEDVRNSLKEIIEEILVEPFDVLQKIKARGERPFVVLFCGVNGTGKTTTVAKIAGYLKEKNVSCVLAAGDTFRAASIEQLKKHGENLEIPVIAQQYGSDPAAVGFDAIKHAGKNHVDCVLIDTAGRMHTAKNLMNEIEKVTRVCKPDVKIFVGESITGNDVIEQAKSFNWHVGIDGIILTKADTDEKGGTALSVGYVTKRPVLFLGTGQEYGDIETFDKKKFIQKIGL